MTTIPEPKKDLFSAVLGQLFSFLDSPTLVRQVSIPDLLITLTMEAIVIISLHIGLFNVIQKRDLAKFLEEVKGLVKQANGNAVRQALGEKKEIITQELSDLFQKNGFPKENTIEVLSQIVEKIKSLF